MNKRVILDVDDVLLDFVTPLIDFVRQNYSDICDKYLEENGMELSKEKFHSYNLRHVVGCSEDCEKKIIFSFYEDVRFSNLPSIKGAREAILDFEKRGYELFIATSRPNTSEAITKASLAMHFPVTFSEFYFSSGQLVSNGSLTKGKLCRELNAAFLIDDSPRYAESCLEEGKGTRPILLDAPWNRDVSNPEILRAENWQAVLEHITSAAQ